jgi:hypothetical protein
MSKRKKVIAVYRDGKGTYIDINDKFGPKEVAVSLAVALATVKTELAKAYREGDKEATEQEAYEAVTKAVEVLAEGTRKAILNGDCHEVG